jgi:hypothetical protein
MNVEKWMIPITGVAIYLVAFAGSMSAFSFLRWRERRFKQRMLEEFMMSLQEKMQTEEDFNEIVKKLRRDFGDE